jgi:hypothetical protein
MAEQKKDTPTKASRPEDKPGTTPSGRADRPTPEGEASRQEKRADPAGAKSTAGRKLAPASESSDPAVHQLLAEQDIARQNEDEDEIKRTQDALADLGYE